MRRILKYLDGCGHDNSLRVGERRLIITINLEPPFDDPQLFANPYLLPILEAALDDGFVLGALGIVCSLPSSPAQHRHADGGFLFKFRPRPAATRVAVTAGIPLIEMNEVHGTTELWLGSHRDRVAQKTSRHQAHCTRGLMYALGFPIKSWWHPKPKYLAASTLVPDILSALVFR